MKKIYKIFVLTLSILAVNLLTNWAENLMVAYGRGYNRLLATAAGMGVVLLVFYPLFTYLDRWSGSLARWTMNLGKNVLGRRVGVTATFLILLFLLFSLYGKFWFGIDAGAMVMKKIFRFFST